MREILGMERRWERWEGSRMGAVLPRLMTAAMEEKERQAEEKRIGADGWAFDLYIFFCKICGSIDWLPCNRKTDYMYKTTATSMKPWRI